MNILVISNMGAKPSAPLLGSFVKNQVLRLKANKRDVEYHQMKWNGDNLFYKIFKYPVFFFSFFISYVFSRKRFDIIHIHYYFPTIICAAIYKFFRYNNVKIVVTCHGSDIYNYQSPNWLYKKLSNIVEHWFFTSIQLKKLFYREVESSEIVCAGYDDVIFKGTTEIKNKKIDCLFVGNLDHNKGVDRLLYLVEALPNVLFSVVGTGKLYETLIKCSTQFPNLFVLGAIEPKQLAEIFQQSKLFLSLSRKESFGLVIAESHACGTPCIVTETDGSMEQLKGWPYIVSKNNSEATIRKQLENHIVNALSLNDDEYKKLQQKVQIKAKPFSLTSIISATEKKYECLFFKQQSEHKNVQ